MRIFIILLLGAIGTLVQSATYAENLQDIYQLAVENDPIMRAAEASYRSQQEVKNRSLGMLLPKIGAEVSYTDYDNELTSTDPIVNGAKTVKTKTTGWQIGLEQKLFDLSSWYSFKSSKNLSESAEAEFKSNQQLLISRTIKSYLDILKANDNLTSSIAEETAIKQQLDQTQQRFDVGLVAITDVHESQAVYDLAKVARLVNQGALEIAYESLSLLTGQAHQNIQILSPSLPISVPEPASRDEWVKLAQSGNLDLIQARQATESAKYAAQATKAGHYPVVTASLMHSENNIDGEQYTQNIDGAEEETNIIQVRLAIPLYAGGAIGATRRQAYAEYDRAKETLAGAERSVTQQVRALHIAVLTQIQQVAARQQSITSTESALEAIQTGYNVGTRNIVDVLNAQRNLYAAQRDYATARYDYIQRVIDLKKAAGLLSPSDITSLNQWMIAKQPNG